MAEPLRILLVEDEAGIAEVIEDWLRQGLHGPTTLRRVARLDAAIAAVRQEPADIILLDLNLPDSFQLATLRALVREAPESGIIIVTGDPDEDLALQAIRAGAEDHLPKVRLTEERLITAIQYARERVRRQTHYADRLHSVIEELKAEEPEPPGEAGHGG
jgi:CheY-like chemotaxis protein